MVDGEGAFGGGYGAYFVASEWINGGYLFVEGEVEDGADVAQVDVAVVLGIGCLGEVGIELGEVFVVYLVEGACFDFWVVVAHPLEGEVVHFFCGFAVKVGESAQCGGEVVANGKFACGE